MNPLLIRRRGMMVAASTPQVYPYLTFEAVAANSSVQMVARGPAPAMNLEYNIGGGWLPYTVGDTITLANVGDFVKMRGTNIHTASSGNAHNYFVMTGSIEASGDVTSLLNGVGGDVTLGSYALAYLFNNCSSMLTPPDLPSTVAGDCAYRSIFQNSGLVVPPIIAAEQVGKYCLYQCFSGCASLTEGAYLRATTLASSCYSYAFSGCTNILSHHWATMNNCSYVVNNNSACTELVVDADTPPTIGGYTIAGLKSDCIIYVPAGSVAAYQAAQYWSARAAYIQAVPNT